MKISILGPKKTFSDVAYLKYNSSLEPVYYHTITEVIDSVDEENLAIIPIENTLDGYVEGTFDKLLERDLKINHELFIPVAFSLVSNAKKLEDIKRVFVQFKAKGQCIKILNKINAKIMITESNIESLDLMVEENDAAIVPSHVDGNYNLRIDNVTDSIENETRFVVISKKQNNDLNGLIKSLVCVTAIEDKPGLLYEILKEFADKMINMTSIMSRPTKQRMGSYNFFIEVVGDYKDIKELTLELQSNPNIRAVNLGLYHKAR